MPRALASTGFLKAIDLGCRKSGVTTYFLTASNHYQAKAVVIPNSIFVGRILFLRIRKLVVRRVLGLTGLKLYSDFV